MRSYLFAYQVLKSGLHKSPGTHILGFLLTPNVHWNNKNDYSVLKHVMHYYTFSICEFFELISKIQSWKRAEALQTDYSSVFYAERFLFFDQVVVVLP